MEHTSPYIYREIKLFKDGSASNYYLDTPEFAAYVLDDIVGSCVKLLADESKKSLTIDKPHVVQKAIRDLWSTNVITDIVQFKNATDNYLMRSALPVFVCETDAEVTASKNYPGAKIVYDIATQTIWTLLNGYWVESTMGTTGNIPWQKVGKKHAVVFNPATGVYWLTMEVAPWFMHWPIQMSNKQIQNAPDFDPNKPWCILTISVNVVEAFYSVDNRAHWFSTNIALRINKGSRTIIFSDVVPFGTPANETRNLQADTTVKVQYSTLFTLTLQANLTTAQVTFNQSSLPTNISYPTWVTLPATFDLPAGIYTFTFRAINNYWTPDPLTIEVNKWGMIEKVTYFEKLLWGSITAGEWVNGARVSRYSSYGSISATDWRVGPWADTEVTYDSNISSILPLVNPPV